MTRNEAIVVGGILFAIGTLTYFNFQKSQVLARDVQRKNDLRHIATALNNYLYDFGFYPLSKDNKIYACGTADDLQPCQWGKDSIRDLHDPTYPPYIDPLPEDPLAPPKKYQYVYLTNTRDFQLLAHLEDPQDREYNRNVEKRKIMCGPDAICNFAVANGDTPVDKDLNEMTEEDATRSGTRRK